MDKSITKVIGDDWKSKVLTDISDGDTMMDSNGTDVYMSISYSAINCIETAMKISGKKDILSVLDFPSGYGRVLRSLVAYFPDAKIVACDLDRPGVDFCVSKFGVKGVYSDEDISKINLMEKFDLIWCGSLLTHLDEAKSIEFLNFFIDKLEDDGVLVITLHGRFTSFVQRAATIIDDESFIRIKENYTTKGYGYADYPNMSKYGISMTSLPWTIQYVNQRNDIKLIYMSERFWIDNHDVLAIQKKNILKNNWFKFNLPIELRLPTITSKLYYSIDLIRNLSFDEETNNYLLEGWGFIDCNLLHKSDIYIVLKINDQHLFYNTKSVERIDVAKFYNNDNYKLSGFNAYITLEGFKKGKYQVGLFVKTMSFTAMDFSEKYIVK